MRITWTRPLLRRLEFCFLNCALLPILAVGQDFKLPKTRAFDWSALKPSMELSWHECYASHASPTRDSFQHILPPQPTSRSRSAFCARLSPPLDYNNASNPHNVSIPVLKFASPPSPSHRSTIFVALGGAGNSRIQDFVSIGPNSEFFDWIDPDFEYDFLTFDNRGFGYSSPSARCFDNVLESKLWNERMSDMSGVICSEEDEGLQVLLAAAKARGELCAAREDEDSDIRQHMTSAYAARDMLEILKKLPNALDPQHGHHVPKMNFLGLSYGTIVGQTFASLYPEHVSRMVLDGTGDGKDWVGKWQMQHLIDVDAIWASFFEDCFEAKATCPLWRNSDSNSTDIETRINEFLDELRRRPLYIINNGNARLITYRDVKLAIYWTTMAPAFAAPTMASILDPLIKGHTNITLDFPFQDSLVTSDCPENETPDTLASSNAEAGLAINCGDAEDISNNTIEDFKTYLSALEAQSSVAAFFQGERKIRCLGWPTRPAWRFTGPFSSKKETENGEDSKLSMPILFMGNRLDPMTSLSTMKKVAKDYPGSVVLEENQRGHTALANTVPSDCTLGYLGAYFRDGTLPEDGTVCGTDCNLFDGSCLGGSSHSAVIPQNSWGQ